MKIFGSHSNANMHKREISLLAVPGASKIQMMMGSTHLISSAHIPILPRICFRGLLNGRDCHTLA